MKEYYIHEAGQEQGPFTFDQLLDKRATEQFGEDAFVWKEGMPEWKPLHEVLRDLGLVAAPSGIIRSGGVMDADFVDARHQPFSGNGSDPVFEAARAQKGILWCILANLACAFVPPAFLLVLPFQIYFIYKLAQALRCGSPVLWAIGMFVPLLSLVLLLILSQKATATIRAAGFNVGLMGANLSEIKAGGQCAGARY